MIGLFLIDLHYKYYIECNNIYIYTLTTHVYLCLYNIESSLCASMMYLALNDAMMDGYDAYGIRILCSCSEWPYCLRYHDIVVTGENFIHVAETPFLKRTKTNMMYSYH